jgi:ferredoxin
LRIAVDYDTCEGNAVCMSILPEVFEVREDNTLCLLDENPPEALRAKVDQAVMLCPTQAISLEDSRRR